MAHALVPGLVERGAEVHFLAPPSTAPLATRMDGVAAVHRIRTQHGVLGLGERYAVGKRLRRCSFDQAIVLPGSFKSALPPLFAAIPKRTGFRGEFRHGLLNDVRKPNAARWPRLVDRFAALAKVAPAAPRLQIDADVRERLLALHRLTTERPVVALCPGADYGPAKRWPTEHFAALARRCTDAGANVWVLGSHRDAAGKIAQTSAAVDLIGRTSLLEAVDLLSAANVVVANDSGLTHVAAALGVPVVALYGSSSPDFTPPLSSRAVVMQRELSCRPCFRRECPFGHTDCLNGITPEQVFDALLRLGVLAPRPQQPQAAGQMPT